MDFIGDDQEDHHPSIASRGRLPQLQQKKVKIMDKDIQVDKNDDENNSSRSKALAIFTAHSWYAERRA